MPMGVVTSPHTRFTMIESISAFTPELGALCDWLKMVNSLLS
jgi:hypothetical protein